MRGGGGIEQAEHRLRDVGVVADRHALRGWKAAHHRYHFLDVRIAVTVDKRQPKHAYIEVMQGRGDNARR